MATVVAYVECKQSDLPFVGFSVWEKQALTLQSGGTRGKAMNLKTTLIAGVVVLGMVAAGMGLGFYRSNKGLTEGEALVYQYRSPVANQVETQRFVFRIEGKGKMKGMVCEGCVKNVGRALKDVPGVVQVWVGLVEREARVDVEKGKVNVEMLRKAIEKIDFTAIPVV